MQQCPGLCVDYENPWKTRLKMHWRMKLTIGCKSICITADVRLRCCAARKPRLHLPAERSASGMADGDGAELVRSCRSREACEKQQRQKSEDATSEGARWHPARDR